MLKPNKSKDRQRQVQQVKAPDFVPSQSYSALLGPPSFTTPSSDISFTNGDNSSMYLQGLKDIWGKAKTVTPTEIKPLESRDAKSTPKPTYNGVPISPNTDKYIHGTDAYRAEREIQLYKRLGEIEARHALANQYQNRNQPDEDMTSIRASDPNLPGWGVNYNRVFTSGDSATAALGMNALPALLGRLAGPFAPVVAAPVYELQQEVMKKAFPGSYYNNLRAMQQHPTAAKWGGAISGLVNGGARPSTSIQDLTMGGLMGAGLSAGMQAADNLANGRGFQIDPEQTRIDALTSSLFGGHGGESPTSSPHSTVSSKSFRPAGIPELTTSVRTPLDFSQQHSGLGERVSGLASKVSPRLGCDAAIAILQDILGQVNRIRARQGLPEISPNDLGQFDFNAVKGVPPEKQAQAAKLQASLISPSRESSQIATLSSYGALTQQPEFGTSKNVSFIESGRNVRPSRTQKKVSHESIKHLADQGFQRVAKTNEGRSAERQIPLPSKTTIASPEFIAEFGRKFSKSAPAGVDFDIDKSTLAVEARLLLNPEASFWQNPHRETQKFGNEGDWSTTDPHHVIHHEVGHVAHEHALRSRYRSVKDILNDPSFGEIIHQDITNLMSNGNFQEARERIEDALEVHGLQTLLGKFKKTETEVQGAKVKIDEKSIAGQVSRRAQYSPGEFIAEVFAGLMTGKQYSQEVMDLYRKYKGFEL